MLIIPEKNISDNDSLTYWIIYNVVSVTKTYILLAKVFVNLFINGTYSREMLKKLLITVSIKGLSLIHI